MRRPRLTRPLVAGFYPLTWLLLLAGLYLGYQEVEPHFGITLSSPSPTISDEAGVNYRVYYYAAEELIQGGSIYDVSPPNHSDFYEYLYPPITIFVFLPTLLLSPDAGYWVFLGLNAVAAGALAVYVVRYAEDLGRSLGWVDAALVFGFCFVCIQMVKNYYFGNINLFLGVGIAAGFYLLEVGDRSPRRQSTAGALFAIVALFKVFPAIIGLYLLRVRAWWATAGAIAVGGGGLLVGELLFALPVGWDRGDWPLGFGMTERWITEAVLPRGDSHVFVGGLEPGAIYYITIQRPLSNVLWTVVPGSPGWLQTALVVGSFAIGLAVATAALWHLEHRFDRLVGALAVTLVAIVVMPSLQYYVALAFLPIVVASYVLEDHPVQPLFTLGGLLVGWAVTPDEVLADLSSYPAIVQFFLDPIAGTATTTLVGFTVILVAVGIAKGMPDEDLLPDRAREARPAGPPLREWLDARGVSVPGRRDPTRGWTVGGAGEPVANGGAPETAAAGADGDSATDADAGADADAVADTGPAGDAAEPDSAHGDGAASATGDDATASEDDPER